jgi:hypothetical protein
MKGRRGGLGALNRRKPVMRVMKKEVEESEGVSVVILEFCI